MLLLALLAATVAPCVSTGELRIGTEPVFCALDLAPGEAIELTIEQGDRDLQIRVRRGDKLLLTVDITESGPERVLIFGEARETAVVEIRSSQKRPRPTIHRIAKRIRAAEPQDTTRLEAQRLATEARGMDGGGEQQLRAARDLLTQALSLARALNDLDGVAIDLAAIASIDYQLTDYAAVIAGSTEALAIASERGLRWTETDCLNNIGVAHWQLGDQRKFREGYARALEIAAATGNRRGEIAIRNNLGLSFRETGENQKSREQYSLALPIARGLGDRFAEGVIHGNLAAAYQALAESRLAIDAATRANALFRMAGADRQRIRPLLRLAELRLQSGELSAASPPMADAIRLIKATADRRAEADAAVLTGKIAFAKKDYITARREANIAVGLYRELRLRLGEAAALHFTGEILERTSVQDGAFAEFNKALRIRKELGARNEEAETLYRLAVIEKRRGHLQDPNRHPALLPQLGLPTSVRPNPQSSIGQYPSETPPRQRSRCDGPLAPPPSFRLHYLSP